MADCKYCVRGGIFLRVDNRGLCSNCGPVIGLEIDSRTKVINQSLALAKSSKRLETRLTRCDCAIEHLHALRRFEMKTIPTIKPPPDTLIESVTALKMAIYLETLQSETEEALRKSEHAIGSRNKITPLSKALVAITRPLAGLSELPEVISLATTLKEKIYSIQLEGYLAEADKAKFKGQKAKAVGHYYDALYLLQTDSIDDQFQQITIERIKGEIVSLTGKPVVERGEGEKVDSSTGDSLSSTESTAEPSLTPASSAPRPA